MVDTTDFSTRWRSVEMTKEIPGQAGNDVGEIPGQARGRFREFFYDDSGTLVAAAIDMFPGGNVLEVHYGQWHGL